MKQFNKKVHLDVLKRINNYRRRDLYALLEWRSNTEYRNYNEQLFLLIMFCLHTGDVDNDKAKNTLLCISEMVSLDENDTIELISLIDYVSEYFKKYEENPFYYTNEQLLDCLNITIDEESFLNSIHRNVDGYTFYGKTIKMDDYFPMEDDYQAMNLFLRKMRGLEIFHKYKLFNYLDESRVFSNYQDEYSNPINIAIYDVILYEESEGQRSEEDECPFD